MTQHGYRPLSSDHEIRVISLCTERDDPQFASGPVHCKIEHVLLEPSQLTAQASSGKPVKGFDDSWPSPTNQDVEGQTRKSNEDDWSDLWPRTLSKTVQARLGGKVNKTTSESRTEDLGISDNDLPWRYLWGDYVALSYVWGDLAVTREIYVDGVKVAVTANLEAALRQLRRHSRICQGFKLWIDALSINQSDPEERSHQVARMKDIYASAWHVAIWLGPEADDSDLAMRAMQYFSLRSKEPDPLRDVYHRVEKVRVDLRPYMYWSHADVIILMRKAVFRAIYHLLDRPYWRRLWILQEIALGRQNMPVLCGTKCIPLLDIYRALEVIKIDGAELGNLIISEVRGHDAMIKSWDLKHGDTYRISEKFWERPTKIIEGQSLMQLSNSVLYGGIFGALILSREAFATDERDHTYGILGLPSLSGHVTIHPDYTMTPLETFLAFSRALFSSGDLNGLRLVSSPVPAIGTRYLRSSKFSRPRAPKFIHRYRVVNAGCIHQLPSWVICWSCPQNPAFPFPSLNGLCLPTKQAAKPIFPLDGGLMTIQGVLFDTVNSLSAFHATESKASYPFNGPQRGSVYGDHDATKAAFWRTLVGNRTHSGDTPPDAYKLILDPKLWNLGQEGGGKRKLFGLNDFYARNKHLRLFDRTLEEVIRGPKPFQEKLARVSKADHNPFSGNERLGFEAVSWAMQLLAWRRLVTTDRGYLGLMPAATKAGDYIAVVLGCNVPLVLRQEGECFHVLGECYVHGIMSGEVSKMVDQGEMKMIDITLC